MKPLLLALALASLAACGGSHAPPPAAAPVPGTPGTPGTPDAATPLGSPPGVRLPDTARPLAYRLALTTDPADTAFTGHVAIDVELTTPAHPLWLNAENLTITAARLLRDGATPTALRVIDGNPGVIGLAAAAPIAPGRVTVELDYRGIQITDQTDGVLRRQDRADWYLVTDLEPLGARRVAPCFDQPGFKVPWQLELTVPAALVAAGNTPIEHEEPLADGRRRIRFAASPPIPSYLFAFAVGPYDIVDAGRTRGGAPMRLLVPRGQAADAAFMAKQSAPLVAALEDYTGIPYPFAKLDHVVIPGGRGGAMENVGLITYAPATLVIPAAESDTQRSGSIATMAHELAHQWFGNLVTTAWWDDLWLNEAFATWAEDRLMAELFPRFGGAYRHGATRRWALMSEGDPGVRAIRQPIVERVDIDRAFDLITYQKGATVLRMFEEALGPERFRAGVHAFLTAHAGGTVTAADLLAALSAATGTDVGGQMAPWLDQPGAPVVSMSLSCPRGGPAVLELAQRRYRAGAAAAAPAAETTWHVPVCVRVPGERAPRCTALAGATGQIALGDRCPALVVPTGTGHYFAAPSPAMRSALLAAWPKLTPVEQTAFAGDTASLFDAGEVEVGALLDLLPRIGAVRDPNLMRVARFALMSLWPATAERDRPALARLARTSFGKLAGRTGWVPRAGEDYALAAMRVNLMTNATEFGRDPRAVRHTLDLAGRWLDDHARAGIPVTMLPYLLRVAGRVDSGPLFERLLAALPGEADPYARRAIASALGETSDPARLVRALELVLAQPEIQSDHLGVFWGTEDGATAAARLGFLAEHLAALLPRVAEDWRDVLAPGTCDPALRAQLAAVLDAHFVAMPTYGRGTRDRTLATADQCIALRTRHAAQLAAYLAGR